MKELILKEISEGVNKLEIFTILDVPDYTVSKVESIVTVTKKTRIKVGWLDKVIGDICAKWDHFIMLQENQQLSAQRWGGRRRWIRQSRGL